MRKLIKFGQFLLLIKIHQQRDSIGALHIAFDGKTLRGPKRNQRADKLGYGLLSLYYNL